MHFLNYRPESELTAKEDPEEVQINWFKKAERKLVIFSKS